VTGSEHQYTTDLGRIEHFKNDLAFLLRRWAFDLFMRLVQPSREATVADFGVSRHRAHRAHYWFEELYPWKDRVTALGREGAYWYEEQFPGMKYIDCDLRHIPLPDNHFDIGICGDVVEHAGDRESQRRLVHEVCRTCRCVFFTTPNRSFPLEVHTLVPFAHWLPGPAFRAVLQSLGMRTFATEEMLNPLDGRAFLSLFPQSRTNRLFRVSRAIPIKLVCLSNHVNGAQVMEAAR
jgi:hypothetical protein